ncbi:MAG: DNA polymerase ligase N-terminal domain-containing protein [Rhizobium sp.]|nr:DNA polymerase ligase N-terminal domain-containing protein [Rhizobium sp.]
MSLSEYRRKRDFKATPEPKAAKATSKGNSFVIQKHAARRLHYDLRLEMDGVLKSWAVTRGPSLVPGEKRLAVHVEDHPLAYGDFEGVIPPGQYGSGEVIVWDRGTWEPLHDTAQRLQEGPPRIHAEGREARRTLASGAHGAQGRRNARELAPDQRRRRGGTATG